jgi:hypothetical protein
MIKAISQVKIGIIWKYEKVRKSTKTCKNLQKKRFFTKGKNGQVSGKSILQYSALLCTLKDLTSISNVSTRKGDSYPIKGAPRP